MSKVIALGSVSSMTKSDTTVACFTTDQDAHGTTSQNNACKLRLGSSFKCEFRQIGGAQGTQVTGCN